MKILDKIKNEIKNYKIVKERKKELEKIGMNKFSKEMLEEISKIPKKVSLEEFKMCIISPKQIIVKEEYIDEKGDYIKYNRIDYELFKAEQIKKLSEAFKNKRDIEDIKEIIRNDVEKMEVEELLKKGLEKIIIDDKVLFEKIYKNISKEDFKKVTLSERLAFEMYRNNLFEEIEKLGFDGVRMQTTEPDAGKNTVNIGEYFGFDTNRENKKLKEENLNEIKILETDLWLKKEDKDWER